MAIKIELEELLNKLRNEKNWSYDDVIINLKEENNLMTKEVKKWEYGIEYPDLDMMYKLSELYNIPVETFVEAKEYSLEKLKNSIHIKIIRRINYILGVSFKVAVVLMVIFYLLALVGAFMFFIMMCKMFTG